MWNKLKWRYEDWILRQFYKYYTVGGHCGFCGKWIPDAIVTKGWEWSYCDKCQEEYFTVVSKG